MVRAHQDNDPVQRTQAAGRLKRLRGVTHAPLSFGQERLWFVDRLHGSSTAYHLPSAVRLRGELDLPALGRAFDALVARHEILRTAFVERGGVGEQVVAPAVFVPLPLEDLRGFAASTRDEYVEDALRREWQEGFDLTRAPLFRARLLVTGQDEHVLIYTLHHAVCDAWSHAIFTRELLELYGAFRRGLPNPLSPLSLQYLDFAVWQRERVESKEGLSYWRRQLADIPERITLPTDRPHPSRPTFAADVLQTTMAGDRLAVIRRVATAHQATVYMVSLAAWAVLLARYSAQDDIVIGSPITYRPDPRLEELIGFFVNSIPIRVRLPAGTTFERLLAEVRESTLAAYDHCHVPFEAIVDAIGPPRHLATSPVFQVVLAHHGVPRAASAFEGLAAAPVAGRTLHVPYELELHIYEERDRAGCVWHFNRQLFDRWRVEQMAAHFDRLLDALCRHPEQPVWQIELTSEEERRSLAGESEGGAIAAEGTILDRIAGAGCDVPDAVALSDAAGSLGYAALAAQVDALARTLRTFGVGRGEVVGVALGQTVDAIVAMLAVLRAGGAYLTLDFEWPIARLQDAVREGAARLIVSRRRFEAMLPSSAEQVLWLDDCPAGTPCMDSALPTIEPDQLAYVIYTSGSTGKNKAVGVTHRGLLSSTLARHVVYARRASRFLLLSPLAFDSSVAGLYWTLSQGGVLIVSSSERRRDPQAIAADVERHGISHLLCVPALYQTLMALSPPRGLASLDVIVVAGEEVPAPLIERHQTVSSAALYNEYGPTEATVWSTVSRLDGRDVATPVSIGRPVPNSAVYVLDQALAMVPPGVPGELYIAGEGLARGYQQQPALTAERFVASPHGRPGARMYRTGDLARHRRDGELEFLGRADRQVKIRGYRVELGEVEAALLRIDGVREAIVLARDDKSGGVRLVAYVIPHVDRHVDAARLRQDLLDQLPEHWVPAAFLTLDRWPLTSTGKVDRRALPPPARRPTMARSPRSREERVLCEAMAAVLGLEAVAPDDNFFELGGDSIQSMLLVSRVRDQGLVVSARDVFEYPTVARLSEVARDRGEPEEQRVVRISNRVAAIRAKLEAGNALTDEESRYLVDVLQHVQPAD